ncbi:MAG: hypothetical protein AAF764_01560 [Pseudomonadota bacterium]
MQPVEIAFALAATAAGIGGLVRIERQIRQSGKSEQAKVFIHYVTRFEDICKEYDAAVTNPMRRQALKGENAKEFSEFAKRYLSIVHQEYVLFETGMLDGRIWDIWLSYFGAFCAVPEFQSEWENFKSEIPTNAAFISFVENALGHSEPWYRRKV